jgi:hypothetical protein
MNATNDVSRGGNGSNRYWHWVDTRKATRREAGSCETSIVLSAHYVLSVWCNLGNPSGDNTAELCGKSWKDGEHIKQQGYKSHSYFSHSKTSHMFIAWRRITVYEHRDGLLNVEHSYVGLFRSCVGAAASISFFGAFACKKRLLRSFLLFVRPSVCPLRTTVLPLVLEFYTKDVY